MDWIELIQNLGFPIVCVAACATFIWKIVNRDKDEAKEREVSMRETIADNAVALSKVADTISEANETNRQLSETNRLLVDKMDSRLTTIDSNVGKILDKMQ